MQNFSLEQGCAATGKLLLTATVMDLNLQHSNSHVSVLLNQDPKFLWDSAAEKYKIRVLHFHIKSMLILCCLNVNLSPCPQVNCKSMFSQEILMRNTQAKLYRDLKKLGPLPLRHNVEN